jgi:hypothetical protein
MKLATVAPAILAVFIFSTSVFAKGYTEYTDSSKIFLILNQALKDVKEGKAESGGHEATYEALRLAGFYVNKISVIDMGRNIHLRLDIVDGRGGMLRDWQGSPMSDTLFFQAPSANWKKWLQ